MESKSFLSPDVLLHVFSFLDVPTVLHKVALVCQEWNSLTSVDSLWRGFCIRDLPLKALKQPPPNIIPFNYDDQCLETFVFPPTLESFKETWKSWYPICKSSFYGGIRSLSSENPRVAARTLACWKQIDDKMAELFNTAMSLNGPASLDKFASIETTLGVQFPLAFKALWSLHDGQGGANGLFGGYYYYNVFVLTKMLSLKEILSETRAMRTHGLPHNFIVFGSSIASTKFLLLDCIDGSVSISTRDEHPVFCKGTKIPSCDGLLAWFESYASRLTAGYYSAIFDPKTHTRMIELFPRLPPALSTTETEGVEVEVSAAHAIESSEGTRDLYAYSIRMSYSGPFPSCQLKSRRWIVRHVVREVVEGEGVIGQFPILLKDGPAFEYQSCTVIVGQGVMEGEFLFFPGTIEEPLGAPFWATVGPFPMSAGKFFLY